MVSIKSMRQRLRKKIVWQASDILVTRYCEKRLWYWMRCTFWKSSCNTFLRYICVYLKKTAGAMSSAAKVMKAKIVEMLSQMSWNVRSSIMITQIMALKPISRHDSSRKRIITRVYSLYFLKRLVKKFSEQQIVAIFKSFFITINTMQNMIMKNKGPRS